MKLQTANVKAGLGHEAILGLTEQGPSSSPIVSLVSDLCCDGMTSALYPGHNQAIVST